MVEEAAVLIPMLDIDIAAVTRKMRLVVILLEACLITQDHSLTSGTPESAHIAIPAEKQMHPLLDPKLSVYVLKDTKITMQSQIALHQNVIPVMRDQKTRTIYKQLLVVQLQQPQQKQQLRQPPQERDDILTDNRVFVYILHKDLL